VTLSPGQTLLEIYEADRLEARFSVPREDIDEIAGKSELEIDGRTYPVNEARIISEVDRTVRAVDVVIVIEPKGKEWILPGQTCALSINKCIAVDCARLPITALVPSIRGLWSCYRLSPTEADPQTLVVEKVELSIVHTDGTEVVVTSALHDGDLIMPSGVHKVVPGMRVQLTESRS
jgi:hypothetical protein